MAANSPSEPTFTEWVKGHAGIVIGFGIVAVLLLASQFMKKGSTSTSSTGTTTGTQQDLSGLATNAQGQAIVYVPTQTQFTTVNRVGAGATVNSPTTTTSNQTTVNTSAPTQVVNAGPVTSTEPAPHPVTGSTSPPAHSTPPPPPVTHKGGLVWDQSYVIKGGDTLSGIASAITGKLRASGMPSTVSVTYNDIYSHNTSTINTYAAKHGTPIKNPAFATPAAINNIFPGESLTVPRWDKNAN